MRPEKPLRIIHCLRAPVGGLFRHVRDLSMEQARRGASVGVICDALATDALTRSRLEELSRHLELGLAQFAMSRNLGLADFSAFTATCNHIRLKNIDIIHGHGAKGGAYARLTARALLKQRHKNGAGLQSSNPHSQVQTGCVYTPHGGSLHYRPSSLKGRIYMTAEQMLAPHTDAIIFESAFSARAYAAKVGKPQCATAIVPNGVLPDEFIPIAQSPEASDFVFVGELRHLKGVDVLLHALVTLQGDTPVTATIVGDGPDAPQFHELCAKLGLENVVTFAGALPAREAFAMGRALVMPSRAESFPYIVLEAAAAGLPLLATDVGGIPEIVAQTDTSLIRADDVAALSNAMAQFLSDPRAYIAKAERLKARISDKFSLSAMTDGVVGVYKTALSNQTAGCAN